MNWPDFHKKVQEVGLTVAYLELMVEYGFLKETSNLKDIQKDAERLLEINHEIPKLLNEKNELIQESGRINPTEIKKLINKQRTLLVREAREKKKLEKQAEIQIKRKERKKYLSEHLVHVGKDYSGSLKRNDQRNDLIEKYKLPIITDENDLKNKLGITLSELKWITYHRVASKITHYYTFEIPKKTGGTRKISAPKKKIKHAQNWINENILQLIEFSPSVHGFIKGKSILSNANQHLNKKFVLNIDLKNFFPSITFKRVLGLFRSLGYSSYISTLLALICTEPERKKIEIDDETYFVAISDRRLPQGASTSPALSNMICNRLDKRLEKMCQMYDVIYSRYADDISFSFDDRNKIGLLFSLVTRITKEEGFVLNNKKSRILSKSNRQEVTGIVINEKINVSRRWVNQLRLEIFQFKKAQEKKIDPPVPFSVLKGKISYLTMVNKTKGEKYSQMLS